MKKLVILLFVAVIFGCGESEEAAKKIEQEKQKILDSVKAAEEKALLESPKYLEKENPLNYCVIEKAESNNNFWGTKSTVHAFVKITSKYTEYKDMELKVQFISKTGSVIGEHLYTRYDYFQPNHAYKIGIDLPSAPKETVKYNVVITDIVFSKQYQ